MLKVSESNYCSVALVYLPVQNVAELFSYIFFFFGGGNKNTHIFSPISKDKSLQVDIFQLLHSNKTRCHETKEIMHKYLKMCTINTVSYNRKQIHINNYPNE